MSTDTTTGSKKAEQSAPPSAQVVHEAMSTLAARRVTAADADERNVRRLADVYEALTDGVTWVSYYIPKTCAMMNPCRAIRRAGGVSFDGSNLIMKTKDTQSKAFAQVRGLFRQAREAITTPGTDLPYLQEIEMTSRQLADMKEGAQERLAQALRKAHTSLIDRINSASERLAEAQEALAEDASEAEKAKPISAHTGNLRAVITDSCEKFLMCLKGAEIFDDTGSLDHLFQSLRDAIKTEAAAINATLQARGVKTVTLPAAVVAE